MAFPRITFNSKNIDFPFNIYRIQISYPRSVIMNRAVSGIYEVLNVSSEVSVQLAFRWLVNVDDATVKLNLYQFEQWAMQGKPWTFACDSSKTANTTLSAGAAAGASSITVTSITGFSANDICVLRSTTQCELVKISGAPSGATINLAATLNFDYANGSRFRLERYWPARVIQTSNPIIVEKPPLHFDAEFSFIEDMN